MGSRKLHQVAVGKRVVAKKISFLWGKLPGSEEDQHVRAPGGARRQIRAKKVPGAEGVFA